MDRPTEEYSHAHDAVSFVDRLPLLMMIAGQYFLWAFSPAISTILFVRVSILSLPELPRSSR